MPPTSGHPEAPPCPRPWPWPCRSPWSAYCAGSAIPVSRPARTCVALRALRSPVSATRSRAPSNVRRRRQAGCAAIPDRAWRTSNKERARIIPRPCHCRNANATYLLRSSLSAEIKKRLFLAAICVSAGAGAPATTRWRHRPAASQRPARSGCRACSRTEIDTSSTGARLFDNQPKTPECETAQHAFSPKLQAVAPSSKATISAPRKSVPNCLPRLGPIFVRSCPALLTTTNASGLTLAFSAAALTAAASFILSGAMLGTM